MIVVCIQLFAYFIVFIALTKNSFVIRRCRFRLLLDDAYKNIRDRSIDGNRFLRKYTTVCDNKIKYIIVINTNQMRLFYFVMSKQAVLLR